MLSLNPGEDRGGKQIFKIFNVLNANTLPEIQSGACEKGMAGERGWKRGVEVLFFCYIKINYIQNEGTFEF